MSLQAGDLRVMSPVSEVHRDYHHLVMLLVKWDHNRGTWIVLLPVLGIRRYSADFVFRTSYPVIEVQPRDEIEPVYFLPHT
jgi:hypothetical protein